jgi:CRISPR-associated endonuclease/helicase Cas3
VRFRHELASLLLLDGPLRGLLSMVDDPDLARYLVLAHHGKLRVQVREPGDADSGVLLGLEQDTTVAVPELLGQPAAELTVDLDQFSLGGARSWTRTALSLRDRHGPFILAYLETVVRIADWRASAGMEVAR